MSSAAVLVVGAYTEEMGGRSTGVTTLTASTMATSGAADWSAAGVLPLPSPSYLIAHPDQPWLFAVSEGSQSMVHSLLVTPGGRLERLSSVETGGDSACHLALAPDGSHLVVAHYGSGSVASVRIELDGRLSERVDLWSFAGSGPRADRQEGPHAHQVVVDGDELLVADLGTDRVHRLRLDADGRFAEGGPPVELPPGFGPRHLVVVEDHLVVAGELSAELWLGVRTESGWRPVLTVPASSRTSPEPISPSALRHDGDTLYLANRGAGTVTVFTLDRAASTLTGQHEFDCAGTNPRDLVLTPARIWVADQTTDRITVFDRSEPGVPQLAYGLDLPSPTCIVALDQETAAIA